MEIAKLGYLRKQGMKAPAEMHSGLEDNFENLFEIAQFPSEGNLAADRPWMNADFFGWQPVAEACNYEPNSDANEGGL